MSEAQQHVNAPQGEEMMRDGLDAVVQGYVGTVFTARANGPLCVRGYQQHHRLILQLFDRYSELQRADQRMERLAVARELVTMVSTHASAEERTLYPLIRDKVAQEDGSQMLYDMMVMDDTINKEHLNYLDTHTPVTDADWHLFDRQWYKFETVEREHLLKEEEEVIDRMRVLLSAEDNHHLWQQWEAALKNAPLKPHPRGPTNALPAKLLHPVAGLMDRAAALAGGVVRSVVPTAVMGHKDTKDTDTGHTQQQQQVATGFAGSL